MSVSYYRNFIDIFDVVVDLDNAFCVETMLNLANMGPKFHLKF